MPQRAKTLNPGDKVYAVYNEKTLALYHIGEEPLEHGMNILGAHIDSPRIDIKQNPLYEKDGLAYLDTHYYGGIKKVSVGDYSAGHSRRHRQEGRKQRSGQHRRGRQGSGIHHYRYLGSSVKETDGKEGGVVIEGENLDLLIGSVPLADEEKRRCQGQYAEAAGREASYDRG